MNDDLGERVLEEPVVRQRIEAMVTTILTMAQNYARLYRQQLLGQGMPEEAAVQEASESAASRFGAGLDFLEETMRDGLLELIGALYEEPGDEADDVHDPWRN